MVAIAGILSPVPLTPIKEALEISANTGNKLEIAVTKITEIISPLSSVRTRAELKKLIERNAPEFLHLRNETGRLIMDELSSDEFIIFATREYERFLKRVNEDVSVLGAEDKEQLIDVIESLCELLQNVLGIPTENQGILTDILLESSFSLQRVDMCLLAVFQVLTRETIRWNPSAIKLLTQTAYEHMCQVEDIFLLHDLELAERLRTGAQTISLEEVKKEIGLLS